MEVWTSNFPSQQEGKTHFVILEDKMKDISY